MPENVRGILAISQLGDLSTLATQANRIIEVTRPQVTCLTPVPSSVTIPHNDVSVLKKEQIAPNPTTETLNEISELRRSVEALTKRLDRTLRGRERSKSRKPFRNRSKTPHKKRGRSLLLS